ncbi:MAG: hypothetical protein P8177_00315 [Gemmatimonadota bacterium]
MLEPSQDLQVLVDRGQRRLQLVAHEAHEASLHQLPLQLQLPAALQQVAALQRSTDDQPELVRLERLGKEVVRSGLQRFHCRTHRRVPGDHDDHEVGVDLVEASDHVQARQARHLQVHHRHRRSDLGHPRQPLGAVLVRLDRQARLRQDLPA